MTEQQYPIHLRKIGEHQIAEFLETLIIELDTHEKMFLELCQVTCERDALLASMRHGRWISIGDDDMDVGVYKCSECSDERWFGDDVTSAETSTLCPYCPNCGAKMDAEV